MVRWYIKADGTKVLQYAEACREMWHDVPTEVERGREPEGIYFRGTGQHQECRGTSGQLVTQTPIAGSESLSTGTSMQGGIPLRSVVDFGREPVKHTGEKGCPACEPKVFAAYGCYGVVEPEPRKPREFYIYDTGGGGYLIRKPGDIGPILNSWREIRVREVIEDDSYPPVETR